MLIMKKILIALSIGLIFVSVAFAMGEDVSKKQAEQAYESQMNTSIDDRLKMAAADVEKVVAESGQPVEVPRMALIDIAHAATGREFEALNCQSIVLISAISQTEDELHVKKAYFEKGDTHFSMTPIYQESVPVSDPDVSKTFGKYRMNSYYLIPYLLLKIPDGQILIDWNKNRERFSVYQTPIPIDLSYIEKGTLPMPAEDKGVSHTTLAYLLNREFGVDKAAYLKANGQ